MKYFKYLWKVSHYQSWEKIIASPDDTWERFCEMMLSFPIISTKPPMQSTRFKFKARYSELKLRDQQFRAKPFRRSRWKLIRLLIWKATILSARPYVPNMLKMSCRGLRPVEVAHCLLYMWLWHGTVKMLIIIWWKPTSLFCDVQLATFLTPTTE